jgi:hypothetical protein
VQVVCHRTRYRHCARLHRMMIMTMASLMPNLHPAVALKFSDDFSHFHNPQPLRWPQI